MRVTIPKPPSLNRLWRNVPRLGRVKSKRYKQWIGAATASILSLPRADRAQTVGPYRLRIELGRRKGSDLDNYAKAISDLLVSLRLVGDDSHCVGLEMVWADDLASAQARAIVSPAQPKVKRTKSTAASRGI
jgi:crossover junction endodeoxyribonuclease RusA